MQNFIPKAHQEIAFSFLIKRLFAALLAGMGLGKTTIVLMAFKHLLSGLESKGMLIVAPLRVSVLTWPHEVKKWKQFHKLRIYSLRTKEGLAAWKAGTGDIYTINYESLPKICRNLLAGKTGADLPVDMVVFDELSAAKSHDSKRINQFRKHRGKFQRIWGLTGTPTPNGLIDLFAQIRLLDNGKRLGKSFDAFRSCYFTIDPPEHPRNKYSDYPKYYLRDEKKGRIESKLTDLALTLRTEDWLDVPPTRTEDIEIHLPAKARAQYQELERKLLLMLEEQGLEVTAVNAAVLGIKLLQITGGAVYDEDRNVGHIHDAKINALRDLHEQVDHEPLLVSIWFQHERKRILRAFPDAREFNEETYEQWNRGELPMLVAHPKSIGHGLNLQTGGHRVVWYTSYWSQELYQQLNARLIRPGQTKETVIYRLLARDTIDDAVAECLRSKGEGQSAFMSTLKNLQELREK